jgi:hypothetical protein
MVLYWHGLLVLSRKAHLPTVAKVPQPATPKLRNTNATARYTFLIMGFLLSWVHDFQAERHLSKTTHQNLGADTECPA